MSLHNPTSTDPAHTLRARLQGEVITPGHAEYEEARMVFSGVIDRHPGAIARVVNDADVATVVSVARDFGAELSVRSGGHGVAGHSVNDGGIVLDLTAMKSLQIDEERQTAWAETGLTTGEYTEATARHGLATGFGDTGSVGIGGITLAGGIGFLVRKYGLTIDNVIAADVVTADGRLLRVDEESHPDLFWAVRGGGGNFGVVTRFQFRLHPVDEIAGGFLILPATTEVVTGFLEKAESAPEELSTILNVMPAPPMPMIPEDRHGELVALAMLTYAGDPEKGSEVLASFKTLAEPIADLTRIMRYPEMFLPEEAGYRPIAVNRTRLVDGVTGAQIDTLIERLTESPATMTVSQLRVLGGAMARVPSEATAFAHRQRKMLTTVAGLFDTLNEAEAHSEWINETSKVVADDKAGAYLGFLGEEGEEGFDATYPAATRRRLAAIKAEYDPENLFHINHNVVPNRDTAAA